MSLEKGFVWSYKNHDFKAYSIAGQSTSLVYNNAKICFDIAQGLPFHLNAKLYCLSHLHADHGAGLNYILSQRSLFRLPQANIMLPLSVCESAQRILQEWMKIEGFEYQYNLIGVEEGTVFDLAPNYQIKTFKTTHRVDSYGYLVYQKKKRLKKEFLNKTRQEILDLKSKQVAIEEEVLLPTVCFTGDTQIEFLKAHPDILKAQILFMECTYLDNKKSIEETRKWGHTHLDEIIENQHLFKNEHISLIHLSARYSTTQAKQILDKKMNKEVREKFSIYPRPF